MTSSTTLTPVRRALRPESRLISEVEDGLGAVQGGHRQYLDVAIRADFADSLEADEALRSGNDQENRWDYLLGHGPSQQVIALEPHSASDGEIGVVIDKRNAARVQLREHLREGATISKWLWVASGKVHFANTERVRLRLDQNGIEFVGTRLLSKHLPAASRPSSIEPRRRSAGPAGRNPPASDGGKARSKWGAQAEAKAQAQERARSKAEVKAKTKARR